jgi:hypothetical protein
MRTSKVAKAVIKSAQKRSLCAVLPIPFVVDLMDVLR